MSWERLIYSLVILLTAMPVHECAHGLVADRLGDNTARMQGRLTLNPLKHLDVFGSILLVSAGVGWAKPVEIDTRNFRHPRRDMALSSLAGPVSNLLMAYVVLVISKISFALIPAGFYGMHHNLIRSVYDIMGMVILINIRLAVFNFLPVPPLDGSKIIGVILPEKLYWSMLRYQRQISLVFMVLLFFTNVLIGPLDWLSEKILSLISILTLPVDLIFYS